MCLYSKEFNYIKPWTDFLPSMKELLDENQILRYRLTKYEELVKQGFLTNPKTEEYITGRFG